MGVPHPGRVRGRDRRSRRALGGGQAPSPPCSAPPAREPARREFRPPDRGALGRPAAEDCEEDPADVRVAAATGTRRRDPYPARGLKLGVEPGALDLARFERLVVEARESAARSAANDLREALALWRGPPLADFTYEPWAQAVIPRLQQLRLTALEERIEADLALGRDAELVGELEALIAEHPLQERLRGQLMLALYRSGRQAEALAVYRDARRMLVEELGIEPSPALQELERAILKHEPELEARREERPRRSRHLCRYALTRFPGRRRRSSGGARELEALQILVQRARRPATDPRRAGWRREDQARGRAGPTRGGRPARRGLLRRPLAGSRGGPGCGCDRGRARTWARSRV